VSKELIELNKRMKKQIIGNDESEITKLREQVAAQAAVIEKLLCHVQEAEVYTVYTKYDKALVEIRAALAIPTDSTQILDEVRRAERERCAQMILNGRFLHDESPAAQFAKEVAAAIRAME
jgi:lipase chaperone LimK